MTTPVHPRERTGRVLLGAALWLVATAAVLTTVAALSEGQRAVYGALLGTGLVLVVFSFGATVVGATAKVVPNAALLVALLTYTLQLLVLLLVFIAFRDSADAQREISETWLGVGIMTATLAWIVGHLVVTVRTPIQPWAHAADEAAEDAPGAEKAGAR